MIDLVKDEIYNYPKNKEFFANNTFEQACLKLTCAFENIFLALMDPAMIFTIPDEIGHIQDQWRGAYREALKKAYLFCESLDLKIWDLDDKDINSATAEMSELITFNEIRNLYEQSALGKYTIKYNEKTIVFNRNKAFRSEDAELYARWVDHEKPEQNNKILNMKIKDNPYYFMVTPGVTKYWDPIKKNSERYFFKKIYNSCLRKIKADSEELENYDFGAFTTIDFQQVYACLVALGIFEINYHFSSRMSGRLEIDKYRPIIIKDFNELVVKIDDNISIGEDKIKSILNILIYDPEFHKDKTTIIQPLFSLSGKIYYSPSLVYFSLAHDKLLYYVKENEKNSLLISRLAKGREKVMTEKLYTFISENSDLCYTTNFVVRKDHKSIAEFDLILFDEEHNKMLLVELKWFFQMDGEYDCKKIDGKIQRAVNDRILKEKVFLENIFQIYKELDIDKNEKIDVRSCIVSKNYSGSDFLDDKIPVFDEYLFKALLKHINFNFDELFKKIDEKNYLPTQKDMGYTHIQREIEYAGYKIKYPSLARI